MKQTIPNVLSEFFWPGIASDIKRFCQSCDICQRTIAKGRNTRAPLSSMPVIDTPFQRVAIDLVGPFEPRVENRNKYKKYYNRKSRRRNLKVGSKVLVLLPTKTNKLLMSWKGPYEVVEKLSVLDYRIKMG